jgi:hypothetical protein
MKIGTASWSAAGPGPHAGSRPKRLTRWAADAGQARRLSQPLDAARVRAVAKWCAFALLLPGSSVVFILLCFLRSRGLPGVRT